MKKIFLVAALLLIMSSPSFATDVTGTNTLSLGGITLTDATSATDSLVCSLSNQVSAIYRHVGTADAPAQWYAIGTYHLGGTKVYGTAQDITAIYSIDKDPGSVYAWDDMPENNTDSNVWSGSWDLL